MTNVKICGLKRLDDALVAADAGADFLGFVFAPSRRQVQHDAVREIVAAVRRPGVRTVGVFVNAEPGEMNRIARACGVDYVQLSGDEPDEMILAMDVPAIQVIHVSPDTSASQLIERVSVSSAELVLIDTAVAGSYGGTGRTFDWRLVAGLKRPVLVAGGLHPDNVWDAVSAIRPWGVDVSSGVETDGDKDHRKIREFVAVVKGQVGSSQGGAG